MYGFMETRANLRDLYFYSFILISKINMYDERDLKKILKTSI